MPLEKIDAETTRGKYIQFEDQGLLAGGKTHIFHVISTYDGSFLGKVYWFSRWRKYSFSPLNGDCVFEEVCLRDIAEFIELKTKEHRAK